MRPVPSGQSMCILVDAEVLPMRPVPSGQSMCLPAKQHYTFGRLKQPAAQLAFSSKEYVNTNNGINCNNNNQL